MENFRCHKNLMKPFCCGHLLRLLCLEFGLFCCVASRYLRVLKDNGTHEQKIILFKEKDKGDIRGKENHARWFLGNLRIRNNNIYVLLLPRHKWAVGDCCVVLHVFTNGQKNIRNQKDCLKFHEHGDRNQKSRLQSTHLFLTGVTIP